MKDWNELDKQETRDSLISGLPVKDQTLDTDIVNEVV